MTGVYGHQTRPHNLRHMSIDFEKNIEFLFRNMEDEIKERNRKRAEIWALKSFRDRSLCELEDCVSAGNTTEQDVDLHLLAKAIQDYLAELPGETRDVFIGRYFFSDSIREVAGYYGMSESKAKSMLYRTRIGLKKYLEQEGFFDET